MNSMLIDAPMLAVIVAVILSIVGLAAAWGALSQRVKQHDEDIDRIYSESREDRKQIFEKLEKINIYIRNNKK